MAGWGNRRRRWCPISWIYRLGRYRWERAAIITAAEPGRELSFVTVNDRTRREETRWQYTMEPYPSGTLLTESFQFLWCPTRDRVVELFVPRGRQVERGMKETLRPSSQQKQTRPPILASSPPACMVSELTFLDSQISRQTCVPQARPTSAVAATKAVGKMRGNSTVCGPDGTTTFP